MGQDGWPESIIGMGLPDWLNLAAWAGALEASVLGEWMRGSSWAYPVVNLVHLLGLVLLVGPMLLLDLRLLGAGRLFVLPEVSAALKSRAGNCLSP